MEVSRSSSIKLATKWLVTSLVGGNGPIAFARSILSQFRVKERDMLENGIESPVGNSEFSELVPSFIFEPKEWFCGADNVLTGCDTWCGKHEAFKTEFIMSCLVLRSL